MRPAAPPPPKLAWEEACPMAYDVPDGAPFSGPSGPDPAAGDGMHAWPSC